jgi:hypothetical protein
MGGGQPLLKAFLMNASLGLWRLYRESPFPKIQVLAGSSTEDRLESLGAIGASDILVVAGGLGELESAINELNKTNLPCVYVLGPAEMHGRDIASVFAEAKALADGTQVHVLERETVVINGIRFAGASYWFTCDEWRPSFVAEVATCPEALDGISTTLWWQDDANRASAKQLCEMARIRVPSDEERARVLHPSVAYVEHQRTRAWLRDTLATRLDGPTVVVTSNAPSRRDLAKARGYRSEDVASPDWPNREDKRRSARLHATTNDDDALLREYRREIDLWIHGGFAANSDVVVEGVRVICRSGHLLADNPEEFMERALLRALSKLPKRARRKAGLSEAARDEGVEHPPSIDIESGLIAPLSTKLSPAAAEMKRRETAIRGILPHLMSKSSTLRACVRRVISEELLQIDGLSMCAFHTEGEILALLEDAGSRFVSTFADGAPKGYPTDVRDGYRYDYYARVDDVLQRVGEIQTLPKRATKGLMRWVDSAYALSRLLEARGVEALFARPSYDALRLLDGSANTVDVAVKQATLDLSALRAEIIKDYAQQHETSISVRFYSMAQPECLRWTLLDATRIREIAQNIVVAFDVTA